MPSQKNKGARGSQKETQTTKKNNSFFDSYLSDMRKDGKVDDVYVSRVIRNLGNGRVEVFYLEEDGKAKTEKAYIRGLFRGKGKHSVDIGVNSVLLVADTGISGPAQYEVMCLLSHAQIRDLRKVVSLDDRLTNGESTDADELIKNEAATSGFDFVAEEETAMGDDDEESSVNVDAI